MAGHERRKNDGAVARPRQAPAAQRKPGPRGPTTGEASVPGLPELKEFLRNLTVARKKVLLYPAKSKVVQQALDACLKKLHQTFDVVKTGLCLQVTKSDLKYSGESVYHDESSATSIAYCLSKDSVRQILFLPGVTQDELSAFLSCFKECKGTGEAEEDFSTAFWEKDLSQIQIDIAANFTEEHTVEVPVARGFANGFEASRFALDKAAEDKIDELLANCRSREQVGDATFEITEEERQKLRLITSEEKLYFPLYDFVDVMLEVMLEEQDAKGFQWALKLIRTAIFALVENEDFEHACGLLEKLCGAKQQVLTPAHHLHFKEMVRSFTDKGTMDVLARFLGENPSVPITHDVFRFMKLVGPDAVPRYCELLTLGAHLPAIAEILIQLGKDYGELFAKYMLDPDPHVVRAMIQVLLKTDRNRALERIAAALRHPDEGTRLLAARTMAEGHDPRIGPYFVPLLGGESRQLFLLALQHFAAVPCPDAFGTLLEIIATSRFHGLEQARQDQCFKALLLADAAPAERFIGNQVLRWRLTIGEKSLKRKAAALRALAHEPTEVGLAVLARFAARKRGELGRVARQILAAHERRSQREPVAEVSSV